MSTEEQIDDDPFLLLSQAKVLLRAELERYEPRSCYSMVESPDGEIPDEAYSEPYSYFESPDGQVPEEAYSEAYAEFYRRFMGTAAADDDKSTPSVLLVAANVAENWVPPEDVVGNGRFLFFLRIKDEVESALFLTYMRSTEHGQIDCELLGQHAVWSYSTGTMRKYLVGSLRSGRPVNRRYRGFEPDFRIYPKYGYEDPLGADLDGDLMGHPYSRFIWEMEYENRDPVKIRDRGQLYMRPEYTRLFLAGKFYAPSADDKYKAAMVLWGKLNDSNDTIVMDAVSFGTEDLSEDNKNEFFEPRANRLVGVDRWRRPQDEDDPNWNITVPFRGFLYKVPKYKKKGKRTDTTVYVLDEIDEGTEVDFIVDLREMARDLETKIAPKELPSDIIIESDDD